MTHEDFEEKDDVTKRVNDWAIDAVKKSVEVIEPSIDPEEQENIFHPLAGHSGVFANDKIIVAASSYLKIRWKPGLFYKSETKMDSNFIVTSKHLHNQVN